MRLRQTGGHPWDTSALPFAFSYLINLLTWVAAFFPHAGIVPRPSASMITCGNSWRGCWALPVAHDGQDQGVG